jgi:hypothetical protein
MKNPIKHILCLAFLLAAGASSQAYDIRSGLLSYYPFDTSTTEDAAFTNDFSAVGSPTLTPGQRGTTALQLAGGSYLQLIHPGDDAINGFPIIRRGVYSVTMWVKAPPPSATTYLFTEANVTNASGANGLFMFLPGGAGRAYLDVYIRTDGNSALLNHPVSSSVVFDDTWHHIAWIDNNGSVQLYIDGVLDGNNAAFQYNRGGSFNFERSAIGALVRNNVSGVFTGSIDDVSVWERPLTQAEVQTVMANGISTPVPALPPVLFVEPVSQTKNFQDAVTFSVVAQGTRPNNVLTYQWNLNSSPILDATNRTYRAFNLTTANSGETYSVTVSGALANITSSNAILTVLADNPPNVRSNLVSFWPMDSLTNNGSFLSTIDTYGRNDLILSNMNEFNLVGGQFGNALEFDNLANTYAVRSSGAPIFSTNGYSVSMWVYKPDGASAFQSDVRVFSESSTNNNTPLFTIGTTGTETTPTLAKIYIRNDANRELLNRASTRPVFDGAWHHILWVDNNGAGKLYVDGVLDETDFTYTPVGTLTLDTTSVGAIVRTTVGNNIFCDIDEVAVWSRGLNFTEVQDVRDNGVPPPLAPTPPEISSQPVGTNVFTKDTVSFEVAVTGIGPFSYQWFHDSSPLLNETNAILVLDDVQISDAGAYKVVVTNVAGPTNSQDAILVVTQRPEPPPVLAIDFNHRGQDQATEPGFVSFTLGGAGATTIQTTRLYGGVEVTAGGNNGTTVDSRLRTTPNPNIDFTQTLLLKDFIYSTPSSGTNGLDVVVKFMQPNQQYAVTVWSYDSGQGAGERKSDWYANGELVKDDYIFNVSNPPTNNLNNQFSFYATTDADGQLVISGWRDNATSASTVFLNALRIALPTAPDIDTQPVGVDVFTGADVTLYVNAVGVGPFTYQWYKGAGQIGGATESVLHLSNVNFSDSETYSVQVGNQIGTTNSAGAVLNVTARPAPAATIAIDFNQRGEDATATASGFAPFSLAGSGAIALPTTRLFGGVEVTVSGSNGTTVDSRARGSITNFGAFTEEKLLRDFIYSTPISGTDGLDVQLRFLAPNQLYNCTIWSFDDQQGATNAQGLVVLRTSDWYANGALVKDNYSFYGTTTNEPADNLQYQFRFTATSDANGTILLQGRRDMPEDSISVFLNALRIAIPQTVIGPVERIGDNLRITMETPDSSQPHQLQSTTSLSAISWGTVSDVTTTIIGPTTLQMEFPAPTGPTGFYRVVRTSP